MQLFILSYKLQSRQNIKIKTETKDSQCEFSFETLSKGISVFPNTILTQGASSCRTLVS